MTWALSYLGANFALIIVVALAVIALGAVAWFAKNWKVAVAAIIVLGAGLAYQQIDKAAYQRRVAEEAGALVKTLQARYDSVQRVNQDYAKRAADDEAEIESLREQVSQTPTNTSPCLDADAARRVGNIK